MFVRNAWYVAAWDHEVGQALLARTLLGTPVVLFRTADGTPVALEDRCCHRHAPLSAGRLKGDTVECGYHGLRFDRTGACVEVPSQTLVPPGGRIASYPLIERNRWLWIWMGDSQRADAALIPDLFWHDSPKWKAVGGYNYVKGAYQRMIDITLDQTHSRYVHPNTLGSADKVRFKPKLIREGNALRCERKIPDSDPPPLWAKVAGITGNADQWNIWRYIPPNVITFDVGIGPVGSGVLQGDRSKGFTGHNTHGLTPETERTTHHFWVSARNFALEDEALTKQFANLRNVFLEDVAMVEAVQRTVDAFPGAPSIDVGSDAPTIQARAMVDQLLDTERSSRAA
jgi:phenylpropionate dioxygenase-like ring-hydroxylating dioxygenase large terminal subunit